MYENRNDRNYVSEVISKWWQHWWRTK